MPGLPGIQAPAGRRVNNLGHARKLSILKTRLPLVAAILLAVAGILVAQMGWCQPGGPGPAAEIRRLGLSRMGETTLLTVILNRSTQPRLTPTQEAGEPQLLVDFPGARAVSLPPMLPGDEILVRQVRVQPLPGEEGVRVTLELFPNRPYTYWGRIYSGPPGQVYFVVGLTPEAQPPTESARVQPPGPAPEPPRVPSIPPAVKPGSPPERRDPSEARETPATPPPPVGPPEEPSRDDYGYREETGQPRGEGNFGEIQRLIPKAAPLLRSLQSRGWTVAATEEFDRPGQRFARGFRLTHPQHPELVVKVVHLPGGPSQGPDINFVILSTENVGGEAASQYRKLRKYSFADIRRQFEDIGDFFDDALKPLRVKLREQTKSLVLSRSALFLEFLKRACPQKPELAEQFLAKVKEKVNTRFEGVQHTLSEDPLVILNMVDFLYVKVYFLGT